MGRQFLDLFAATAENERITALKAQYPLALLGQLDQLQVDLVLGHRVIGAAFTDVDTIGIPTTQFENRRRHQTVVEHHVRLLHQPQGAEGQQVGITRSRPHQIHLTRRMRWRAIDLLHQQPLGFSPLPGQLPIGDRPLEYLFPERPTLLHSRKQRLDLMTETRRQPGQLAIGRRNPGFHLGPDQPRQNRGVTTAGDRDHQRRTVDDGREDHTAQSRRIHHVDRHATPTGIGRHLGIERFIIGRGNDQHTTVQVGFDITAQQPFTAATIDQLAQLAFNLGWLSISGATTRNTAPASASKRDLRKAISPPPTTSTRLPRRL